MLNLGEMCMLKRVRLLKNAGGMAKIFFFSSVSFSKFRNCFEISENTRIFIKYGDQGVLFRYTIFSGKF